MSTAEVGAGSRTGAAVLPLGRGARAWRAAVVAVLTALFLAGSLVGEDSWWPFSPWRMFSTSQAATGSVDAMAIQVRTTPGGPWRPAPLTPSTVGLNRAEIEGRSSRIVREPWLLGTLAASHARLRPADAAWVGVRLVREQTVVVDRRPTGEVRTSELARWTAP